MIRVGIGEDIHLLVEGRPLVLGGVTIPHPYGLLGHSDGDAVLHAIADAILGATASGDIGHVFPPEDMSIKGIDSKKIMLRCVEIAAEKGYRIINVDCNIVTQAPKLKPHIETIRESLASLLGLPLDFVSVKAKTNEGVDAVGEGKAIRTNAVVLVERD
ncbi:MAG: 2-C-methyl-D-erythritol 2,4-cyclodiphosphate synthase [Erysipelotrichaceae bacterium]|nr:2-C-methyl-D-erythritol 2,4-cyclodiphosphate synthase [Erysipelotrichaceae bacterium]